MTAARKLMSALGRKQTFRVGNLVDCFSDQLSTSRPSDDGQNRPIRRLKFSVCVGSEAEIRPDLYGRPLFGSDQAALKKVPLAQRRPKLSCMRHNDQAIVPHHGGMPKRVIAGLPTLEARTKWDAAHKA